MIYICSHRTVWVALLDSVIFYQSYFKVRFHAILITVVDLASQIFHMLKHAFSLLQIQGKRFNRVHDVTHNSVLSLFLN